MDDSTYPDSAVLLPSAARRWCGPRQACFLVALRATGNVSTAAAQVGMSRESVYRVARRPDGWALRAVWTKLRLPAAQVHVDAIISDLASLAPGLGVPSLGVEPRKNSEPKSGSTC